MATFRTAASLLTIVAAFSATTCGHRAHAFDSRAKALRFDVVRRDR